MTDSFETMLCSKIDDVFSIFVLRKTLTFTTLIFFFFNYNNKKKIEDQLQKN